MKNLTTKTLKSPPKLSPITPRGGNKISSRNPSTGTRTPANALDQEEDEWNGGSAWDRSTGKSFVSDEQEWHTTSWARDAEERVGGGGGKGGKRGGKAGRRAKVTEADRILEKIGKGEKLKAPAWEGGGKVEREGRSVARRKGSWRPRRG